MAISRRNAELEPVWRQASRNISAAVESMEKCIRDSRTRISEARKSIDEADAVLARDGTAGVAYGYGQEG